MWRTEMGEQVNIRELSQEEVACVSGGFGIPSALGAVYLAAQIGWGTGQAINSFNQGASGMSFGQALYFSFH